MNKGCFITFEGIDGSGKSTQIGFLRDFLAAEDQEMLFLREPGGTPVGEEIRRILLEPRSGGMEPEAEALLYAASRAELVRRVIRPALENGKIVVCDRYVDSSIAYQGYGRGLGDMVREINRQAAGGVMPDVTFLIDVPPETGAERIAGRGHDRIESEREDFFRRVREGYLALAREYPERIVTLDGTRAPEAIRAEMLGRVKQLLRRRGLFADRVQ